MESGVGRERAVTVLMAVRKGSVRRVTGEEEGEGRKRKDAAVLGSLGNGPVNVCDGGGGGGSGGG